MKESTNNYGLMVYNSYKKDLEIFKINYTTEESCKKVFDLDKDLLNNNKEFVYLMVRKYPNLQKQMKNLFPDLLKIETIFNKNY